MEYAKLENLIQNENFNLIKDEIVCSICKNIKLDPIMCTKCQNSYCSNCIEKWKEKMPINRCPSNCENPTYQKCRFLNFLYDNLIFKCKNGCSIEIPFEELKNHYSTDCLVIKERSFKKISEENAELKEKIISLISEKKRLENCNYHLKLEIQKLEMYKQNNGQLNSIISKQIISNDHGLSKDILFYQEEVDLLTKWIKNGKNLEPSFSLIYKASTDGDKGENFHKKCNNIKPTLILIKSNNNRIFGGYTESEWKNDEGFVEDENSFVFSLNEGNMYKSSNKNFSIYNRSNMGPCFGNWDLAIVDNCFANYSYDYTPIVYKTSKESELADKDINFLVSELEVYKVNY